VTAPWPEVPLTAVADLVRGVSYPKTDSRDDAAAGYVPVLRATNIQDARLVLESDLVYVAESNVSPEQRLRPGDIVVATSSGSKHLVGKSALLHARWNGSFGAFCAGIRPKPNIESRYLAYFLQSPRYWKEIGKKALGVNINNLRRGDLETLSLPLPPAALQREIVAEIEKQFSRLDEGVANLQRVKANLRRYEIGTLRALVCGQDAASESGERPELPRGWEWKALPELGELSRGKSKHRPRDDPRLFGGPYPFVQTGDIRRSGGRVREFTQTYSDFGLNQSRLWPAGTLCITIAANIAETGILSMPACFPDSVVGFLSRDTTLTRFVEFFMRTAREDLERFAPATAQKNINLAVLERVVVPVPPSSERERIVAEVDRSLSIARGVEAEVDANLKRAQALRQAVLQRAFALA
jgi:type I restriction enzyme S subunit